MQPVPVPVLSLRGLTEFISALALNMSLLISFYLICLLNVVFSMFTVSRSNTKGHVHKKKKKRLDIWKEEKVSIHPALHGCYLGLGVLTKCEITISLKISQKAMTKL